MEQPKQKYIYRVDKNRNYSVINNLPLRDEHLSWGAKGLLAYILTLPDTWVIHQNELMKHSTNGLASTRSLMKELRTAGYLEYQVEKNEKGQVMNHIYIIHENPQCENRIVENNVELPEIGFPQVDKPQVDNCTLLSTDIILNTNISKYIDEDNFLKSWYDKMQRRFAINITSYYDKNIRTLYQRFGADASAVIDETIEVVWQAAVVEKKVKSIMPYAISILTQKALQHQEGEKKYVPPVMVGKPIERGNSEFLDEMEKRMKSQGE